MCKKLRIYLLVAACLTAVSSCGLGASAMKGSVNLNLDDEKIEERKHIEKMIKILQEEMKVAKKALGE